MVGRARSAGRRRTAGKAAATIALMLMLVMSAMASSASAYVTPGARFVWESCDSALPGGNPPPTPPPGSPPGNVGLPLNFFDTCAEAGGSIGIQQYGALGSAFSFWLIEIPPTTGGFVESETISAGTAALGPGNDHTFVYENGWPGPNLGETQRTFLLRIAAEPESANGGAFSISWNCDGNYAPGCGAGPIVWADHIAVTEVDPNPPKLVGTCPSLLPPHYGGASSEGHLMPDEEEGEEPWTFHGSSSRITPD